MDNLLAYSIAVLVRECLLSHRVNIEVKGIHISITYQDIGIKTEELEHLFDRYYRVENAKTKTISGFGIDLYLCSEIIHRHNGQIWAESEIGRGSTFWFGLLFIQ
ncbi:MAG: ATP-binding protein [Bacteroidota bacterium]